MTADPSRAVLRTQAAMHVAEQHARFIWTLLALALLSPLAGVGLAAALAWLTF